MPGTYEKNKFDLAGFSVGLVSKKKLITKDKVTVTGNLESYMNSLIII